VSLCTLLSVLASGVRRFREAPMLSHLILISAVNANTFADYMNGAVNFAASIMNEAMGEAEYLEEALLEDVSKMMGDDDKQGPAICDGCGWESAGSGACCSLTPKNAKKCTKTVPLAFFTNAKKYNLTKTWKREFAECLGPDGDRMCRTGDLFDPCQPAHTIGYPDASFPEIYCKPAHADDNDYLTCFPTTPPENRLICRDASTDAEVQRQGGWQVNNDGKILRACLAVGIKQIVEKAPQAKKSKD